MMLIYADNAATTKMCDAARQAMIAPQSRLLCLHFELDLQTRCLLQPKRFAQSAHFALTRLATFFAFLRCLISRETLVGSSPTTRPISFAVMPSSRQFLMAVLLDRSRCFPFPMFQKLLSWVGNGRGVFKVTAFPRTKRSFGLEKLRLL